MTKYFKFLFLLFLILSLDSYSQENKPQHFSVSDGLPNSSINDINQDKIGYLWLATNNGYSKFDGVTFVNYPQIKANCIFTNKSNTYIGLKNGLLIINNNISTFYKSKEILKIRLINGKIVLATVEGLSLLKENYILPLKINTLIDFSIINDVISFKDHIFIASNKGLWSINELYKPKEIIEISNDNYVLFLKSNNQLITATKNNGLKIIHNNAILKNISTTTNCTSIKKINNEIWVATKENGIDVLDANNFTFKRKINKYNSDISSKINTVFKDNQNSIWLASTNKGLYKFSYTKEPTLPKIYFESVLVNYTKIDSLNTENLELQPNENNISLSFKSIDLKNGKNIKYQYQLNNETKPWTTENKVSFANLKSGKYNFAVQAKNGDLVSKKISFSFFIKTPFYKKVWFYIICGVILCLIFAVITEIYIRKINKKNEEKITLLKRENHLLSLEQKALQLQMNPHFIFNVLNGIKALGNSGNSKELNKTISQFSVLLRSVLNNSRLEEISLQDEIETLKNYLDLEQKMNKNSFNYAIETFLNNIDAEEILIPPMLLQPFVENCIKHAFKAAIKNATIKLNFKVHKQSLYFSIEDNGIGFYQSKKEKSNTNHQSVALQVTKERIEHLSKYNSFTIEELKTEKEISGTKISFKIPLKTDY
jgi:sensor histidine kinase YesM